MNNSALALNGWLRVNIPATGILLAGLFMLSAAGLPYTAALLVAGAIGWLYWYWAIAGWIRWAATHDVDADRILRIGRFALLLRDASTIDRALSRRT
jgi:hypothetical protein